ncbi:SusC/RagA family TonB-linked outer membrane protein [Rhodohalobacter sp. 614A]|uniref:SusC/RagA family TonB-linked outer membrane protein n=1 Tax=Rhodohalobacter sp. 614A TaxID=2908649 RepID=UPI001F23EF01|nr:TonB-dependent receptor [Rhodohalobacter sp. 614A]
MNDTKLWVHLSIHKYIDRFVYLSFQKKPFWRVSSVLFTALTICFSVAITQSYAQNLEISGQVIDANSGEALPGVNILIVGTDDGTITNVDGEYSISAPEDGSLRFTFIGYKPITIPISGRSTIDVEMEQDIISGDELLVIGYSVQERRDMTGSISVVDMDQFETRAVTGDMVSKQLQGMASGVSVVSSGQPGETPDIRIRGINTFGNNAPLVVIDGVPGNMNNLNSNDIESIQVLKDASSASIYGARAANGVIVITTKKGGGSVQVNYSGTYGVDWQGRDNPWDIASPQDHANLVWTAQQNSGQTPSHVLYGNGSNPTLPDFISPAGASEADVNLDSYYLIPEYTDPAMLGTFNQLTRANKEGTDWFNEIFRPAATMQHNISVNGGSEIGNFLFSVNYLDQEGTLKYNFRDRVTLRANTSFNLGENFRIGENLSYSVSESPTVAALTEGSSIGFSYRIQPIVPVYDIAGNFGGQAGASLGNAANPVAMMYRTRNNESQTRNLFGNVFAEWDFLENVMVRTSFGGELWGWESKSINYPSYEEQEPTTTNGMDANSDSGYNWTWTNTLRYTQTLDRHEIELLVGAEAQQEGGNARRANVQGFFSLDPNYVSLSTGSGTPVVSGWEWQSSLLSFFTRLDYIFNDRYIVGATIRRDGSSRFANNQWGWFPAVSVGWRISQENFMQDIDWLTDLKLIAGYGVMGNQINVDPANAFTLFTSDQGNSFYAIDGSNSSPSEGFRLDRIGNPDAEWERNVTANIGIEASLFNDQLQTSIEYYWKDVTDLLYNPELIGTFGVASQPYVNVGNMTNRGLDMSLSTNGGSIGGLQYNATLTFTSYNNEIVKISNDADFFDQETRRFGVPFIRNQVGESISSFYGYDIEGFWQDQGEIDQTNSAVVQQTGNSEAVYQSDMAVGRFRYKDVNGDGQITPDDRTFLGNPNPDFTYGLNLGLNYKAFDLNMFWYGSQGNDIWNGVKWFTDFYGNFNGAKSNRAVNDSWTPENRNAQLPIQEASGSFSSGEEPNSYFVEDGSYLRLRSLQLGYTLPADLLQRAGIRNVRLYVQGNNLITFTGYNGPDPEIGFFSGDGGGGSTNFGIDEGQYPTPKQFLFGINISI